MEFIMKIRNDWIGYKHYETLKIDETDLRRINQKENPQTMSIF